MSHRTDMEEIKAEVERMKDPVEQMKGKIAEMKAYAHRLSDLPRARRKGHS